MFHVLAENFGINRVSKKIRNNIKKISQCLAEQWTY